MLLLINCLLERPGPAVGILRFAECRRSCGRPRCSQRDCTRSSLGPWSAHEAPDFGGDWATLPIAMPCIRKTCRVERAAAAAAYSVPSIHVRYGL